MTDTSYPALGFNPAPGTAQAVGELAQNLERVAADIGHAHDQLANIGRDSGIWKGEAAQAFEQRIGPLPDYLQKANESLGGAGKALAQWGHDLSSMQHTAANYEAEAAKALQQLQQAQANPDLKLAGQRFPDQASLQQAQSKLDTATQVVTRADKELEGIRQQAKRLLQQHNELVQDVIKALNKAKDEAIPKPGLLDRIGQAFDSLGKSIENLASTTWNFIQQHADDIAKIGDILSAVGSVLSIATVALAAVPVVGEVVGAAAITVNAAALAAHGLAKAAGANVSWTKMGFDALGVIPGGGAINSDASLLKAAPRLLKAVTKGGKGIESLGEAAEAGGKVISRLSTAQMGKWAGTFDKVTSVFGRDASKASELSSKIGGMAVGVGVKVGAKVGVDAGMDIAQPYIHRAEDGGKEAFKELTHGQVPSAGKIFNTVMHGSAA